MSRDVDRTPGETWEQVTTKLWDCATVEKRGKMDVEGTTWGETWEQEMNNRD